VARLLEYSLRVARRPERHGTTAAGRLSVVRKETEMFTPSKSRIFLPLLLVVFLFSGAVSAQAYEHRDGDRVVKGAAIGAALGTLLQITQGRTEGHQLLRGALVGGSVGAVVGAYGGARNGYYSRDGYYSQEGYYDRDGDYRGGSTYRNGGYDRDRRYDSRDRDRGYDRRDCGSYRNSDRDGRYDYQASPREDSRYRHR